jgi:thiol-disulfide isomerase/thioredoxin
MIYLRLLISSVCFLLFFHSGCAKKEQSEHSSQSVGGSVENVAAVISVEPRPGKAANFSWKDESGKTMSLDSYRGKVTLINFWATWCGPCKHELPDLVELSKQFSNSNVKFIGVSVDRGPNIIEDVRAFVKEQAIPYQNVLATDELVDAYGNIRMIPTSFLLDADGTIVQTLVGLRSKEFLTNSIQALLK